MKKTKKNSYLTWNKIPKLRHGICFETQAPPIGRNMCYLEKSLLKKDEEYDMGLYQKMHTNIITYETTDTKENQKVEYLATKQEDKKVKNQILCNK